LARTWMSYGVRPDAVVGHSVGEIAAAYIAGALSLEDAVRVVALRSRALREITGVGAMASLAVPPEHARELIAPWGARLLIAAYNGPASTAVSGDADAIDELLAACERDQIRAKRVAIDYASHSPHAERVRDRVLD